MRQADTIEPNETQESRAQDEKNNKSKSTQKRDIRNTIAAQVKLCLNPMVLQVGHAEGGLSDKSCHRVSRLSRGCETRTQKGHAVVHLKRVAVSWTVVDMLQPCLQVASFGHPSACNNCLTSLKLPLDATKPVDH